MDSKKRVGKKFAGAKATGRKTTGGVKTSDKVKGTGGVKMSDRSGNAAGKEVGKKTGYKRTETKFATEPSRERNGGERKFSSERKTSNTRKAVASGKYSDTRKAGVSEKYSDTGKAGASGKFSDKRKAGTAGKSSTGKNKEVQSDACPYARKCGGCHYQGTSYEKQLHEKQEFVKEKVGEFCKVLPIIGMDNPYHYRNKVHAVFDIARGGTIISGVYKAGTHEVVNIDTCQIEDETATAIIRDIRGLLRSFKIKTYDEDTGYGLLRHVLVRRGFHSGEVMVVLVLGSPILPSKNNFVKALLKLHPEITTIILNVNNKRTSMVLGDKETVLYGKGFIEDTLCGCKFSISAKSFYQINPVQTEILYGKAMEFAQLTGKERVVDAYSGIGTIGLIAASKAKEVISVELNRDAVRDATRNAKRNNIKNVEFYQADAGEFMVEMAEYNVANRDKRKNVDVVFMDPPRAGSDEAFLSSVVRLYPEKVVYVSCNPETLAVDLKYLTTHGYRAVKCQPVDMFPFTGHCEVICLLQRVK